MKKLIVNHYLLILNILVCLLLLALPHFLFGGKLYISGDDTRLYYAYPFEYFREFTFSSWHHFSSVGANGPTQFMIPFLIIWSILDLVVDSKSTLSYLGFSLPLVLGFLFLQMLINELIGKKKSVESFAGSFFFITSPILVSNQYFIFLSTIWLVPLLPLVSYLFLKFLRSGRFKFVLFASLACTILSIAMFSIPWILGYILPISIPLIAYLFFGNFKNKKKYVKRSVIFAAFIILSQSFWLFSFLMTYFGGSDVNFGSKVLSDEVADTFSPTVLATATGNIIYPLLNLFHRQIAFDFGWDLKNVFESFFDKVVILNVFYIAVVFSGFFTYKRKLVKKETRIYLIILFSFLISLYFFTVNIGPLKDIFLLLGNIPGFVMFRNFYDKFALSYIFYYATLISISLIIINRVNARASKYALIIVISLSLINFTQVGSIVNAPLWQTKSVGRNIEIPEEYLDFMAEVGQRVPNSDNIITIPFGTALYSVIKDENSNNAYIGTSPVKLFSGVNDLSGFMSFYFSDAKGIIENLIINKQYDALSEFLRVYNVNYAFFNLNVPKTVLNSWVFDQRMNEAQNEEFKNSLFEEDPVLISENGNYMLFKAKNPNTILVSKDIYFQRVNEFKFRIFIENLKDKRKLLFNDSFSGQWKLYPVEEPSRNWCRVILNLNTVNECESDGSIYFEKEDLMLTFKNDAFSDIHKPYTQYFTNSWEIDSETIKKKFGNEYYSINEDGSINIELILYFYPQNYFYIGVIISILTFVSMITYMVLNKKNEKK